MERLKGEIIGQPGMRHCLIVMNADGSGHVISSIDAGEARPRRRPRASALAQFHDDLEAVPEPEIFEVVADWKA